MCRCEKRLNIAFYLPGATKIVSGGYKIIYTYANILSQRGHKVSILYGDQNLRGIPMIYAAQNLRRLAIYVIFGTRPRWFELERNIEVKYLLNGLSECDVEGKDVIIATAVDTATDVYSLQGITAKKCYFIQDFENWKVDERYVIDTFRLGLHMITVSEYLKGVIQKYTKDEVSVVPNAIDLESFQIINPIEKRDAYTISMLYHILPNKGSRFGIDALKKLKKDFPQLRAAVFGTCSRPKDLPKWIKYTKKASRDQLVYIYNHSALFLCPVIHEGFGLTGAESMACGCALVSTDYAAGKEYAIDGWNALLCEAKNTQSLYDKAKTCMEDDDLRIRIARQGAEDIKKLSWERAVEMFERELI